jgi:hypothetical protein
VYALWSPSLIIDDWALAAAPRFLGWDAAFRAERPVAHLWFYASYFAVGTSPVGYALLMATLNAVVGGLLWTALGTVLERRAALLTTLAWAVLANRGTTRMWAATSGQLIALIGVLAAFLVARRGPPTIGRVAVVVAIACASVLSYEGAGGFAAAVVALSAWRLPGRGRWIALGAGAAALAATAAWALGASAKAGQALGDWGNWFAAQLGTGILPSAVAPLGLALLGVVAWSAATLVLPSFRTEAEERLVLLGAGVAVLGIAPFLASGFPVGTDGIFDRGNLYGDVGVALVLAGTLGLLWRIGRPAVATGVAAVVLVVLASQNAVDLRAFHDAGVDGRRLLASVDELPYALRTRGPLVLPNLPNRGGVAMFVEDYDIAAALALRYDTGYPYPDVTMALVEASHRAQQSRATDD